MTEGVINYKLSFPFNEFVNINTPKGNKPLPYEPMQNQVNQEVYGNDNEKVQFGYMKSCELSESLKNQGLAKNFANPLQLGRGRRIRTLDTRFWRSFPTPPANGLFALVFHLEIVKIRRKYDTLNNNHLALSEHL